jgi:urease alpha subunit
MRPMFGGFGKATGPISVAFTSSAGVDRVKKYGLSKRIEVVKRCRGLTKNDMKLNDATPQMRVDPETYEVFADGVHMTCEPASKLPLAQKYFLF